MAKYEVTGPWERLAAETFKGLTGTQALLARLDKALNKVKDATLRGLIKAQSVIHADMDRTPPKIPVEFDNLRSSYYCVTSNEAVIAGKNPTFTDTKRTASGTLEKDHASVIQKSIANVVKRSKTYGPSVIFGFSAYYSTWVHENMSAENWTRKGSGAHFFAAAFKRNKNLVLKIIADDVKKQLASGRGSSK